MGQVLYYQEYIKITILKGNILTFCKLVNKIKLFILSYLYEIDV